MAEDAPAPVRVRIWRGRYDEYPDDPDEIVPVEPETPHVWQANPRYHSPPLGIDVHPADGPATLNIYTSDSVRSPPGYDSHVERSYWDGPVERGLPFPADHDYPPYGCELWDRVMFFVEPTAGESDEVSDDG